MYSHDWNCNTPHNHWDCPNYPTSNVRVITAFDRHADEAMALANADAIDASMRRHPAGKEL